MNAKTDIHFNPPMDLDDPTQYLRHSMAWSFYGDKLEQMLVQTFNFSFGERNDDYYNDTNYVAWYARHSNCWQISPIFDDLFFFLLN